MDNDNANTVDETKTPRFTKKFAAKIAAGVLAFGGVCALGYGIAKSGHNTPD
jgi:hypothetical protein